MKSSKPEKVRNEGNTHVKVLGIVGSPRRNGNTEILVDEVLKGAEEAGALVEKIILNELDIAPCQACNACQKNGFCVQEDDMRTVLERMEQSQVWVLGTPVYWWGPTAQFKAFLDRWYGARQLNFKGRRVVLVIPLGASDENFARHTIGMLTSSLNYKGAEIVATVLALGAYRLGVVRSKASILTEALAAGRKAVQLPD